MEKYFSVNNVVQKKFSFSQNLENKKISSFFQIQKKREDYDYLKKTQHEPFNPFHFKYPLGLFSGCRHFSFRINFKEYKIGLKPAKFSLLLNQFVLNLELFIDLIKEILNNNYPLQAYEDYFGEFLNDIDLKIHFLVVLRPKRKKGLNTKFYIIPQAVSIFIYVSNYGYLYF